MKHFAFAFATTILVAASLTAQADRPKSPRGQAATQIGDHWVMIDYGRPILRGRTGIFGEGEGFGKKVNAGAPVWRAGANQSTRLMTDVDLMFGEQTLPAGEYSVYIELKSPSEWHLILSSWGAQQTFSRDDKDNLWGSYGYTADKDVVRVPMTVSNIELSVDQLTFGFINGTDSAGAIALWWDQAMAMAPFTTK